MPGGTTSGAMQGLPVTPSSVGGSMTGAAENIVAGAGGRPDGVAGFVHDLKGGIGGIKEKVDPVLGPIADVGVATGQVMDMYNKLTGAGQPPAGRTQSPAQAAQSPIYNPYIPTKKVQATSTPVNIAAGAMPGVPGGIAPPAQMSQGPVAASYVPMSSATNAGMAKELSEEEIEEFKRMLQGNGNFLSGTQPRMMA